MNISSIAEKIIKNQTPCIFVSSHPDDAIFSAGELISYLAPKTKVKIVTVFTEASNPPHTLSAKAFLRQCNYQDGLTLFKIRREEDIKACQALKIKFLHLGFIDASFRKKKEKSSAVKILGGFIPELGHIYPTYRMHIVSGKIAGGDENTLLEVEKKLREIKEDFKPGFVFCPLGVGNNADHIITRDVCQKIFSKLIFWEDFPYNLHAKIKKDISSKINLGSLSIADNKEEKIKIISLYKSQIKPMFPRGIVLKPEVYYINKDRININSKMLVISSASREICE